MGRRGRRGEHRMGNVGAHPGANGTGYAELAVPSEANPETGCITDHDVTLSAAERWQEDGFWVIRSLEFDLIGSGETVQDAVDDFERRFYDLMQLYAELANRGDAAPHEVDRAILMVARISEVIRRHDAESKRFFQLNWGRGNNRQQGHGRRWVQKSLLPEKLAPVSVA